MDVVAVVLGMVLGEVDVIWRDAYQLRGKADESVSVEIPQAGSYSVWARTKPATLIVGSHELRVTPTKSKRPVKYAWSKLGDICLDAGHVKLDVPEMVAGLVLASDAEFDPKRVVPYRYVFDEPKAVDDSRVTRLRDTDTRFAMTSFASKEDWEAYAERLRRRILISCGLFPLPERTPLNAQVAEVARHEDFIVEKVHFEARPGFLVTGNLYRPIGKGPYAGVVCPHGHWGNGRLENSEDCSVPGRCITFARMGTVAFSYDMIGRTDSRQFPHNWGGEREKLWGIHPFAMQLWSSMRAVDFLQGLPYVAPERIACTGASGGGTQTFALMAVDPRVKVAAPVNMISCSMQGGCLCENAPIIRLNASNMEIGALMAPRPLLLVSATGDWTKETPQVEFPAIRSIYRLYAAEDRVENVHIDAGHNYNRSSREAVYRFFGKWLLGAGDKYATFSEPSFTVEPEKALRVFPDAAPEGYPNQEQIIERIIEATRTKWEAILPKDAPSSERFRKEFGVALADVLGTDLLAGGEVIAERIGSLRSVDHRLERLILHHSATGAVIPALLYACKNAPIRRVAVVVHGEGKAALADSSRGGPGTLVAGLLSKGTAVLAIDVFLTGEYHGPGGRTERTRGKFPDTFLPTDTACRVHDVLAALEYARSLVQGRKDAAVYLAGLEKGGLWCLLAAAVDGAVPKTLADAYRFNNSDDQAWVRDYYVPCLRSIGDVVTAAALIAPRTLWVTNTGGVFDAGAMRKAFDACGGDLQITETPAGPEEMAQWLQ